jgi:hypothetical protein
MLFVKKKVQARLKRSSGLLGVQHTYGVGNIKGVERSCRQT